MENNNTNRPIEDKIDVWKASLLDLSKRNRMINFRKTKSSTLKILEPNIYTLFDNLANQNKLLTFKRPVDKDTDVQVYSMISLLEALSYELPVQLGDIKTDETYLNYQRTVKNLRAKSRLALEEQGINILYLSFGFIKWYSKEDKENLTSPLVLMPVTLIQDNLSSPYKLKKTEDDIEVNPTLSYLFKTRDNIQLPPFELKDKSSLSSYLEIIKKMALENNWEVIEECSLGLLSFLKISMYEDLEKNRERIVTHPVLRTICGDISGITEQNINASVDLDAIESKEFHCVLNSDSSQQKAIQLSKQGHSFVLQGPPGTGKSQTIANIIAEALWDGKKVLFVSEKLAALEVVLKRLSEVNLADFCLPLHNYKANKKEILESIGRNWDLIKEQVKSDAFYKLDELDRLKSSLNQYATTVNTIVEPFGETVYSVYGKLAEYIDYPIKQIHFNNIGNISSTDFSKLRSLIRAYQKALDNLPGKIDNNPWYGAVVEHYEQEQKSYFNSFIGGLDNDLTILESKINSYYQNTGFQKEKSFENICQIINFLGNAIKIENANPTWFDKRKIGDLIKFAEREEKTLGNYRQQQETVDNIFNAEIEKIDIPSWLSEVRDCLQNLKKTNYCSRFDESDLLKHRKTVLEIVNNHLEKVQLLLHSFTQAKITLGIECEDTSNNLFWMGHVIDAVLSELPDNPIWYSKSNHSQILNNLSEINKHLELLNQKKKTVSYNFTSEILKISVKSIYQRFKNEYKGFTKIFKQSYRNDVAFIQNCLIDKQRKVSDEEIILLLADVIDLEDEQMWFDSNLEHYRTIFGSSFNYTEQDCVKIQQNIVSASNFLALFSGGTVPEKILNLITNKKSYTTEISNLHDIRKLLLEYNSVSVFAKVQNLLESYIDVRVASVSTIILPGLLKVQSDCLRLENQLKVIYPTVKDKSILSNILFWADYAYKTRNIRNEITENSSYKQFEPYSKGLETDWNSISIILLAIQSVISDPLCNTKSIEYCKSISSDNGLRNSIKDSVAEINDVLPIIKNKIITFNAYFPKLNFMKMHIQDLSEKYELCSDNFDALEYWRNYSVARNNCDNNGLSDFTRTIETEGVSPKDVEKYFLNAFYQGWINDVITRHQELRMFHRTEHEQNINDFCYLDDMQLGIAQKRIREKIIRNFPDKNFSVGEAATLKKELMKKARIKPLRKLFSEIPNVLLALKPCMMMSPLSVAYFLNNETFSNFDLVIFDEASQIFPQDAIGAICRGKQAIIAGDMNQLPPTNFFMKSTSTADNDLDSDDYYDEDLSASILEAASGSLPTNTLLWHYRSRDERLIAFSNRNIYKNELHTFPTNNESRNECGLEFIYVEDGYYESGAKRRNLGEAKKCVELVKEHILNHPERSLGIIAFSESQQQTISEAINTFIIENPGYQDFFDPEKEESFFVKNLESVQGDERDTIIFSVGYGKTEEQKKNGKPMTMRFGPLANSGGERRLNVAVTRAKYNIKLVSSIMPDDIDLSRTISQGVRLLRRYMEYAMNPERQGYRNNSITSDEFADVIAKKIINKGYSVEQDVGYSNYRINIAVKHPDKDVFVAGIECDGPMYYSSETAHDRDHLCNNVLTRMGWNLIRIWSTEWNKNPDKEIDRLCSFLEKSILEYDALEKEREKKNSRLEKEIGSLVETVELEKPQAKTAEFGFIPYKKTSYHSSNPDDITLVSLIISIEQPIHINKIISRINEITGKLFSKQKVEDYLRPSIITRRFIRENDFIYMPNWKLENVRIPGNDGERREIEEIYPGEIKLAMLTITEKSIGITKEELFEITRKSFGFDRTGPKIRKCFDHAYDDLTKKGLLIEIDGKIHAAKG